MKRVMWMVLAASVAVPALAWPPWGAKERDPVYAAQGMEKSVYDADGDGVVDASEGAVTNVTAADVGAASPNLDDTDASVEWEDAADLDASGAVTNLSTGVDRQATVSAGSGGITVTPTTNGAGVVDYEISDDDAGGDAGGGGGGGFVSMGDLVYIPGSGVFDAGGGPAVWDYESAYQQITARGSVEYGSTIKDREYRFFWKLESDGAQTNTLRYAGMSADSTNSAKAFLYLQLEDANNALVYEATNSEFAVSAAYTIYASNIVYSATGHVFGTVITGSADTNGIGFIDYR